MGSARYFYGLNTYSAILLQKSQFLTNQRISSQRTNQKKLAISDQRTKKKLAGAHLCFLYNTAVTKRIRADIPPCLFSLSTVNTANLAGNVEILWCFFLTNYQFVSLSFYSGLLHTDAECEPKAAIGCTNNNCWPYGLSSFSVGRLRISNSRYVLGHKAGANSVYQHTQTKGKTVQPCIDILYILYTHRWAPYSLKR